MLHPFSIPCKCVFVITLFLVLPRINLQGQNLVPNSDFEDYSSCPTANSQYYLAIPWTMPPGSGVTTDYFNACHSGSGSSCFNVDVPDNFTGVVPAFSGNGYMGIIAGPYDFCPDCREYVQVQLTSPLVAGITYFVSMRIRPGNLNKYLVDKIGLHLSPNAVFQPSNQPITSVTPQVFVDTIVSDTSQWTLVADTFTAAGGEEYITIGNFNYDIDLEIDTVGFPGGACILASNGSMYLIDSVFVGLPFQLAPLANFISNDSSICELTCLDFLDLSTNNPTSWEWQFPGANPSSSTDQNPTNICYADSGIYDVTLIVTNAAGSDTLVMSGFITVNGFPSAGISASGNVFTAEPGTSYQWFLDNIMIPGATNQVYTANQSGLYTVMITDSNGCSASADYLFSAVSLSSTDTTLCEKFCIDFSDQSFNNPVSWQWSFPGASPVSSTDQNPANICYDDPGLFDVMLVTTDGSGNTDTLFLDNFITVFQNPFAPVITQNGNILTSSPADSYQWQLNSIDIPSATNQSFEITESGLYTVIITDTNGCVAQSSIKADYVGIDDDLFNISADVYSIPLSGIITVECANCPVTKLLSVKIYNALAQQLLSESEQIYSENFRKEISLEPVSEGVYFIELAVENYLLRKKIIITK